MDILIVDDDLATVSNLKAILRNLGHTVVGVVSTGTEAIQKARDLNPDLVLIEIKLKDELGGVEAAKKIGDLYHVPIIFLTVFIKNCLNKSLQLPENAVVLSKPIKQNHLKYAIKRVLDH